MAADSVATRYAQAAFEAAKTEGRIDETLTHLTLIAQLIQEHPQLSELMLNPDVDPEDKVGVFDRVLGRSWSDLTRALVHMVVAFGRSECLPGIAEAFQAMVDQDQGRMRVVVRSARPLSEETLGRLRTGLEHREGRKVELAAEIDTELLGGLQILLDHRIIDGSIRQQLADLRQRLKSVRVH